MLIICNSLLLLLLLLFGYCVSPKLHDGNANNVSPLRNGHSYLKQFFFTVFAWDKTIIHILYMWCDRIFRSFFWPQTKHNLIVFCTGKKLIFERCQRTFEKFLSKNMWPNQSQYFNYKLAKTNSIWSRLWTRKTVSMNYCILTSKV